MNEKREMRKEKREGSGAMLHAPEYRRVHSALRVSLFAFIPEGLP